MKINLIKMFEDYMANDCGCTIAYTNMLKKYFTFHKPGDTRKYYRLTISNKDVSIYSITLNHGGSLEMRHFVRNELKLLSFDLHDPSSFKHILNWAQDK